MGTESSPTGPTTPPAPDVPPVTPAAVPADATDPPAVRLVRPRRAPSPRTTEVLLGAVRSAAPHLARLASLVVLGTAVVLVAVHNDQQVPGPDPRSPTSRPAGPRVFPTSLPLMALAPETTMLHPRIATSSGRGAPPTRTPGPVTRSPRPSLPETDAPRPTSRSTSRSTSRVAAAAAPTGGAGQRSSSQRLPADGGPYTVVNAISGSLVTVANAATQAGAPVVEYHRGSGTDQQWQLRSGPAGTYQLMGRGSGLCLALEGTDVGRPGAYLVQLSCASAPAGTWRLKPAPDRSGSWLLQNVASGNCVGLAYESTEDSTPLNHWTCSPTDQHQRWWFVRS